MKPLSLVAILLFGIACGMFVADVLRFERWKRHNDQQIELWRNMERRGVEYEPVLFDIEIAKPRWIPSALLALAIALWDVSVIGHHVAWPALTTNVLAFILNAYNAVSIYWRWWR